MPRAARRIAVFALVAELVCACKGPSTSFLALPKLDSYKTLVLSTEADGQPPVFDAVALPDGLAHASFRLHASSARIVARAYGSDVLASFLLDARGQLQPKSALTSSCAQALPDADALFEARYENKALVEGWKTIDADPLTSTQFLVRCPTLCDDRYRLSVEGFALETSAFATTALTLDAASAFVATTDGKLFRVERGGHIDVLTSTPTPADLIGYASGYRATDGTIDIIGNELEPEPIRTFSWPSALPVNLRMGPQTPGGFAVHAIDGFGGGASLELWGVNLRGDLVMFAPTSRVVLPSGRSNISDASVSLLVEGPGKVILNDTGQSVIRYSAANGGQQVVMITGDAGEYVLALSRSGAGDHFFFLVAKNLGTGGALVEADAALNIIRRIDTVSHFPNGVSLAPFGNGVFVGASASGFYFDAELGFCSAAPLPVENAAMRFLAQISKNEIVVVPDKVAHGSTQMAFWVSLAPR
jgi:hypothetical protein